MTWLIVVCVEFLLVCWWAVWFATRPFEPVNKAVDKLLLIASIITLALMIGFIP